MKTNSTLNSMILPSLAALVVGALVSSPVLAQGPKTPPTISHPKVKETISIQESVTDELMTTDGILGTAVGLNEQGEPALVIYVNSEHKNMADIVAGIPKSMGGRPVKVEVTEPFRTMIKAVPLRRTSSGGGISHTAIQTPPIKLGTSGGWSNDLANGYCCGGTLGSLVEDSAGTQYVLSNYHVLESDIVSGGNNTVATPGDNVIQPGLIDASCKVGNTQPVSTISGLKSLPNSNVDAAIAQVTPNMVKADGEILEIGTISNSTIAASINQAVKKSGRTTGLTKSSISALNATVSVAYDNECAGSAAFTKTFTGQIIIKNRGSKFLNSGDSGSLMVEDKTTSPKAVGLLFAGSSTLAVANPIGEVLNHFSATMVGQ
ncbi:MAG: hypothetical protein ISR72_04850 [Methylobacter sp.]|nr:hypothetical protein [Methylobacter sp.]